MGITTHTVSHTYAVYPIVTPVCPQGSRFIVKSTVRHNSDLVLCVDVSYVPLFAKQRIERHNPGWYSLIVGFDVRRGDVDAPGRWFTGHCLRRGPHSTPGDVALFKHRALSVANNQLTGTIVSTWSALTAMTYLNISKNSLSGTISTFLVSRRKIAFGEKTAGKDSRGFRVLVLSCGTC